MAPDRAWYSRFKKRRPGAGVGQQFQDRADYSGGASAESTERAYEYLLGSLRTNAPGYADQNYFEMAKAYTGAAYLAVNTKSIQAGEADARLVERELDEPDAEEPLSLLEDCCRLFHRPNPDDGLRELIEQISLQYDLTGTALVWLPHDVEDAHDVPEEMYVLPTASCLPQPVSPRYPNGAYLVQPWYPSGPYATVPVTQGVGAVVPAEQIVRIKTPHPFFRWIGYATMYAISTQIDSLRMADLSRMNAFTKGIDPTAVLTWDPSLRKPTEADLRRLETQLQAVYGGPANAGRIFMAPMGADVKKLSNTPAEMAYQEGWAQLLDFTCATFGVNKAVAGMTGDLNYATLYASWRGFHLARLDPFLGKVAEALTRDVLHRFFSRNFFLKLKGKGITDESLAEQQINTLGKLGLAKVGELRKAYNKLGFPVTLEKSDRDDEWCKPDGGKGQPGTPGGGAGGMMGGPTRDGAAEKERPDNPGGANVAPQPDRKPLAPAARRESLAGAVERALSNGHAKPHRG